MLGCHVNIDPCLLCQNPIQLAPLTSSKVSGALFFSSLAAVIANGFFVKFQTSRKKEEQPHKYRPNVPHSTEMV